MPDPDDDPLARALQQLDAFRGALGDAAVDAAAEALRQHARPAAAPARVRQVSILFADVAGSTAMLARVAADEAMELLGDALQGFVDAVQQAGGRVLRHTGDGIKAAFGTTGLREDETERAVRAGLQILDTARRHAERVRQSLGIEGFGVRVGIHTGPVLLGGGPEAERTAMGHAVHLAARMEQSAPVGRLRVSDTTWSMVRGLFRGEEQPPLTVKGHDEPLRTWLVDAAVPAHEAAPVQGVVEVHTPMVGRDGPLQALLELHRRCLATGRGAVARVVAEAGVGKTRLRQELLRALELRDGHPGLMQARAHPALAGQPYGLLRQLLARWLDIRDDQPAPLARQALLQGLAPWLPDGGALDAPRIGQLLGMDFADHPAVQALPGAMLREHAVRALQRLLRERAHRHPLLLVLDDVHWADAESLAALQGLFDGDRNDGAALPLTLLMLTRPLAPGPGLPGDLPQGVEHLQLTLAPLEPEQGARLLQALLAPLPDPPATLCDTLLQRSGGNPFFLHALVRMLIDDGVIDTQRQPWQLDRSRLATLRVPPTLVGVLQARLDALPAAELRALQLASVVGAVFWDDALRAIDPQAPQALPALVRRGLVQARPGSTFAGAAEHRFAHALLHEVTYATVLKAERRAAHSSAGHWLSARVGDRAVEFRALTAEHFERAGDDEQALHHWDLCQVEAAERYANEAALNAIRRALALPALVDRRWRYALMNIRQVMLERMARVDEAKAAAQDLAHWAEACDDDAMRADLCATRMLEADREGRPDEALALADRAVVLASSGDPSAAAALALAHGERAWLATLRHDWPTVDREVAAGLKAAAISASVPRRQMGYGDYHLQLRAVQLEALAQQHRHMDVLQAAQEALATLSVAGSRPRDRFHLLERLSEAQLQLGRVAESEATAHEALTLADAGGLTRLRAAALVNLARARTRAGRAPEAEAALDEAERLAQASEALTLLPSIHLAQGHAARARGAEEAARRLWQRSVEGYQAQQDPLAALEPQVELAGLQLAQGDAAAAQGALDAVLAAAAQADGARHPKLGSNALMRVQQALQALGDPRAPALRTELRERLQALWQALPDEADRRRLVTGVPCWAALEVQA